MRFWYKLRRYLGILNDLISFRYKIMGLVLAVVIFLGLAVIWETRGSMVTSLRAQLDQRALSTAKAVAAQSTELILTGNRYGLQQLLLDVRRNSTDIRYVFVEDATGRVLAHTFGPGFPTNLLKYNRLVPAEGASQQVILTDEGLMHDAAVALLGGQLGTVRVGLSEVDLWRAIWEASGRLLIMTTIFSVFFVMAGYLLTEILAKPVRELAQATKTVARGDLNSVVTISSHDEFGQLAQSFNQMTDSLRRSRAEIQELSDLRAELLEKIVTTQETERQRIARELHDETGGALTGILLRLKALENQLTADRAIDIKAALFELRQAVGDALTGVRRMALELRPVVFDELGLTGALQKMVRDYSEKFNININLEVMEVLDNRLPQKVEFAIYRVVQESLNNVIKHAKASEVSILLEPRDKGVRLILEDNGRGFDQDSPSCKRGLGLFGIRERVNLLGGNLTIESEVGQGTTIYADIPVA